MHVIYEVNRLYNISPESIANKSLSFLEEDITMSVYHIESIQFRDGCPSFIRFINSFYTGGFQNHINLPYIWELQTSKSC